LTLDQGFVHEVDSGIKCLSYGDDVTSTDFIDTCLLLDLETGENNRIHKIGAVFSGQTLERKGNFKLTAALAELDALADQAKYILGVRRT
jgi:hypothetical protein